ncbi:unnamed protein product [Prunus armeniaca]
MCQGAIISSLLLDLFLTLRKRPDQQDKQRGEGRGLGKEKEKKFKERYLRSQEGLHSQPPKELPPHPRPPRDQGGPFFSAA